MVEITEVVHSFSSDESCLLHQTYNHQDREYLVILPGPNANPPNDAPFWEETHRQQDIEGQHLFVETLCSFWLLEVCYLNLFRAIKSQKKYHYPNWIWVLTSEGREIVSLMSNPEFSRHSDFHTPRLLHFVCVCARMCTHVHVCVNVFIW